jgi:hypothetical protein
MSKEYVVWVDETITRKVYFVANGLGDAERLIGKVESGELDVEDLPEVDYKVVGNSQSFGFVEVNN